MKQKHESVQKMWENYLKSIGADVDNKDRNYTSWYFCDNEKSANHLVALVKEGTKRATASLYYCYEAEGEDLPQIGDYSIVTNWDGVAQCIIQIQKINIVPFKDVTEGFAKTEGEGDKSLEYWRKGHKDFFARELSEQGKVFSEDILVVCEEFDVVYK